MTLLQKCKQYVKKYSQYIIPSLKQFLLILPNKKSDRFLYCKNQLFYFLLPVTSLLIVDNRIKNLNPMFVLKEKTVQAADGISIFSNGASLWMGAV